MVNGNTSQPPASSAQPTHWVLIRGLLRSEFHWRAFPEALTQSTGAKVSTVELMGNGKLHRLNTPLKLDTAVENLRQQLNLKAGESYGLIGISLGGMLATRWAQLYPNEIERLVLINSSSRLSTFTQRLLSKNYVSIVKLLLNGRDELVEEFILDTSSNFEKNWRPHLASNIDFLKQHPIKTRNFFSQLNLSTQTNFKDVPACPKLILASKADKLVSYTCSEDIAKAWNCEIRYHNTAGHDLPLDDTPWILEQIKR